MKTCLILIALVFATGLIAADTASVSVTDWGIPGGLAGLSAAIVWSVKKIVVALEKANEATNANIAKLCDVAHRSIDEFREARDESMAARRTFASAMQIPGHTAHIPRPKLRTTDDDPGEPRR